MTALTTAPTAPFTLKSARISAIVPDGREPCVCIAVAHPSRLYITRSAIVTHNTTVTQQTPEQRQFDETAQAYGGQAAYEQAKAAGQTKLNYRQWVQVRTPAFIRWFGDHVIAAAKPKRQASTFADAREQAKAFQGKPLDNVASGITATVSRNNLDKMLSGKAVGKSEDAALHALAVANLDSLFESAIHGWSKQDRDGDQNIKAIHRFFAPLLVDGKAKLVKMTVKETVDANHANGLYTVEAVSFSEDSPAAQWADAAINADGIDPTSVRSAGLVQSLAQRVQGYNPDEVSKVIDPDTGEPLVMYHGTDKEFSEFKPQTGLRGSVLTGNIRKVSPEVYYFTPDAEYAKSYGEAKNSVSNHLMPVFLRAKWLAHLDSFVDIENYTADTESVFENEEKQFWQYLEDDDFRSRFIEDWDDGSGNAAAVFESREGVEYAVFSPNQIKSATGNTGAFSPESADIRFSRSAKVNAPPADGAGWQSPSATKFDDMLYSFVDKNIDLKRIMDSIRSTGKAIKEDMDAYLKETLFHGRVATRTKQFIDFEVKAFTDYLSKNGMKIPEVEEFMHARHAPEANAILAQRNPNQEMIDAGLEAAQKEIERIEGSTAPCPTQRFNPALGHLHL